MDKKEVINISIRYLILIILGLFNLYLFYLIFTPLTVYPSFWLIKLFYGARILDGNVISFSKGYLASIIPACVGGAAYYLLTILNLSTPLSNRKRLYSLLFLFSSFLLINIIRIFIFASLITIGFQYFDLTHAAVWYLGSTVFVVIIWFVNVRIFDINDVPVFTDIRRIYSDIKSDGHIDNN